MILILDFGFWISDWIEFRAPRAASAPTGQSPPTHRTEKDLLRPFRAEAIRGTPPGPPLARLASARAITLRAFSPTFDFRFSMLDLRLVASGAPMGCRLYWRPQKRETEWVRFLQSRSRPTPLPPSFHRRSCNGEGEGSRVRARVREFGIPIGSRMRAGTFGFRTSDFGFPT
jgi:hypothetical protein